MEKDLIGIVQDLNDRTFVDGGIEHYQPYEMQSDGFYSAVLFMGTVIWNSENDDREWLDDDTQEPIIDYLVKESKTILNDLNKRMNLL